MERWSILAIVIAYFGLLLLVAWLTGRKGSNNTAFFLGNKRSPWYIVSIGMIGTSLSGVTFVSVPGLVRQMDMTYMQVVFGFFFGYILIARILLPLYYRLNLTSIYSYLDKRIGPYGYRTGACFFLLSKLVGAAARLYLVIWILHTYVFDQWHVSFTVTAVTGVFLVWLYTFRGGIRTIIWTDTLQALCLLAMLVGILWQLKDFLTLDMTGLMQTVAASEHFRLFEFKDWGSTQHFVKQFLSGVFIPVVMTGLDQDMMQKNLSCRNLREAQRNMYSYGFAFIPINFLFLCIGILLLTLATQLQITLPEVNDDILPLFCTSGMLGYSTLIFFTVGIIAAAFSSADSALTALTTSFCVDILGLEKDKSEKAKHTRMKVHLLVALVFTLVIISFRLFSSRSLIDAIYMIASFTYGPLLGLFAFGLFTRRRPANRQVPCVCIAAPLICYALDYVLFKYAGYKSGYEILLLNGALTFAGLWFRSTRPETCK
ncbi:MAG: sodium:solute symporter [Tannerella sp.]|nr:sodium:solute symporter [Tannerella sp.]